MSAAKLLVLVACVALSQARLVRRDAPEAGVLQDIQKHAADIQKTFSEQFQKLSGSENTAAVQQALKEGSDSALQQLSTFSRSLQDAASDANEKTKEAVEQTRQSLQRKVEELRRQHPDVEQNAAALRDNLKGAFDHALQETQNLMKVFASNVEETNQKLAPKVKAAFDDFVKQAEAVHQKVKDAAAN